MPIIEKIYSKLVLEAFSRARRGELSVTLPDGSRKIFGGEDREIQVSLKIHNENFYRRCVFYGAIGCAESYLAGEWGTEDLTKTMAWFILNSDFLAGVRTQASRRADGFDLLGKLNRLGHVMRPNSRRKSRDNISEHYDLGNDFFQLWLDPTMTYSAAYYNPPDLTLEAAQRKKWDQLCRKLQLGPKDRLLEIGCGWGGFAIYAATHFGCHVTGATISEEQFREARQRVAQAGIADRVEILFSDYRDLTGRFDKIVSIEMLEAVGDAYLETYFAKCHEVLKPGGLLALQMITCPDSRHDSLRKNVDWIQKHIFPGSLLLSLNRVNHCLAQEAGMIVHGVDDMGPDYAVTLRRWAEAFNQQADAVRALGFDERFRRLWRFYLSYCEAGFRTERTNVVQLSLTKA